MTRWHKGELSTISRGPKIKLHATNFYTFFSLFKIGDLKNLRSINSNQACATE